MHVNGKTEQEYKEIQTKIEELKKWKSQIKSQERELQLKNRILR